MGIKENIISKLSPKDLSLLAKTKGLNRGSKRVKTEFVAERITVNELKAFMQGRVAAAVKRILMPELIKIVADYGIVNKDILKNRKKLESIFIENTRYEKLNEFNIL